MKIVPTLTAFCVLLLASYSIKAQVKTSGRQDYFIKYSQKLPAPVAELEKAFTTAQGAKIKISFADFSFNGTVASSIKRYHNLHSVIIKAPGMDNTLLSLSKITNDDQSVTYVGHILNEKYADGFELKKEGDGTYTMNKIRTDELIEDY